MSTFLSHTIPCHGNSGFNGSSLSMSLWTEKKQQKKPQKQLMIGYILQYLQVAVRNLPTAVST